MKRRNQIVTVYIPGIGDSQDVSFNISLSKLQEILKKAIKDNCDVIKFKVKNRNVELEIEKVKQIIQIAKKTV